MGKFIKHEDKPGPDKPNRKQPKAKTVEPATVDLPIYGDLGDLAEPLVQIANALRAYVHNATIGENSFALFTGSGDAYSPVRLVLEGEAVDKMADGVSRIADALEKKT